MPLNDHVVSNNKERFDGPHQKGKVLYGFQQHGHFQFWPFPTFLKSATPKNIEEDILENSNFNINLNNGKLSRILTKFGCLKILMARFIASFLRPASCDHEEVRFFFFFHLQQSGCRSFTVLATVVTVVALPKALLFVVIVAAMLPRWTITFLSRTMVTRT
jgi:hypothetical protein